MQQVFDQVKRLHQLELDEMKHLQQLNRVDRTVTAMSRQVDSNDALSSDLPGNCAHRFAHTACHIIPDIPRLKDSITNHSFYDLLFSETILNGKLPGSKVWFGATSPRNRYSFDPKSFPSLENMWTLSWWTDAPAATGEYYVLGKCVLLFKNCPALAAIGCHLE